MKFNISLLLFFFLYNASTTAQTFFKVKGLVLDSTKNAEMDAATVCVINSKDSILQTFSYSKKGHFEISNLPAGKFLIMVSYPDYADYVANFTLSKDSSTYDFGNIKMILKATLLKEVIIRSRIAAIKIKGDTTEFNAAAYATQKNAKVEDLLKQLPGMKINQSGEIIFQGETVSRILLDGEEFFSDDPSLVSKTIRADMVKKLQVYDEKSEKAKLTGVEDGVKVKTINIQLSEDKKKGVFGKLEAGLGDDGFYMAQAAVNKFSPKEKISVYGNIGNTGKVGLNRNDASKFGIESGMTTYLGSGLPEARDAGAHYDSKFNKNKQSINANYSRGYLAIDYENQSETQNNLPGNFNKSLSRGNSSNSSLGQMADASLVSQLDSTSSLNVKLRGSLDESDSYNGNETTTLRGNGLLLNENFIERTGSRKGKSVSLSANYTKRLAKKGRSFSLNASSSFSENRSSNYLKSELNYYGADGLSDPDSTSNVNQYKKGISEGRYLSAGISYNEPLSKAASLNATYNYSKSNSVDDNASFNQSTAGVYDIPNEQFSSDFELATRSHNYGLSLNYYHDKLRWGFGTNISGVNLKQTDRLISKQTLLKFINWQPNIYFTYQLTKAASIMANYYGNTRQPSISQLQPLRQNNDPLNITIGNMGLRPEFSSRSNFNYRVYQPTKDRGINLRASYNTVGNAIVNDRTTDSAGLSVTRYLNLKGRQPSDWSLYAEVYSPVTKYTFILSISVSASSNKSFNYINGQLNEFKSMTYSPQINIWKNRAEYSYYLNIGPNLSTNSTSLQKIKSNNRGVFTDLGFYTKLPRKFFIGSDANFTYTAANEIFDRDFSRFLLKGYLGRTFLKNESLKLTLTANDMLNQNTGYSRSGGNGNYTESRSLTIGRYFMFSLIWDFNKFGKSPVKKSP